MSPKAKVEKRYYAQVGSESIEIAADQIDGALATSAPVLFYRVRVTDESGTSFEGVGDSWKAAEAMIDKQSGAKL